MRRVLVGLLGVASLGFAVSACGDHINITGTPFVVNAAAGCPAGTEDLGANPLDPTGGTLICAAPVDTSDNPNPPPAGRTFFLRAQLVGLEGTGLVVSNNGTPLAPIAPPPGGNGITTFGASLPAGTGYNFAIVTQPSTPSQTCAITNGQGTLNDNVTFTISCSRNPFPVGGTLSGLTTGTVTLTNRGGDDLVLAATDNGPFTFASRIPSGAPYNVEVKETTGGARCTVASGTGTVGNNPVTGVVVNCAIDKHTVGGTITGVVAGVQLRNGGQTITVNADGSFTFPTPLDVGTTYDITVATQPQGQLCTVANGQGTIGTSDINTVRVTCSPLQNHQLHVVVAGLEAGSNGLVINNLGDMKTATADGTFDYAPVINGTAYSVRLTNPTAPAQNCAVVGGNADGQIAGGDVTVNVVCQPSVVAPVKRKITVHVSGIAAASTGALVHVTGGQQFNATSDQDQTFTNLDGTAYNITVDNPTSPVQTCTVTGRNGAAIAGNITADIDVDVVCVAVVGPVTHTLSVNVSGLQLGSDGVRVANGADSQTVRQDGTVDLGTYADGTPYTVTSGNATAPLQTCNVVGANANGTLTADVTVNVVCDPPGGGNHALIIHVQGHQGALPSFHITNTSNGDQISIDSDGDTQISSLPKDAAYNIDIEAHAGEQCFGQFQNPGTMPDQDRTLVVVCN